MTFSIILLLGKAGLLHISLTDAPVLLGFICGGSVIFWFSGASMQAVTTGAYRAVEFIKKNLDLTKTEADIEDSKTVVRICTQYAQKGMWNIFIALMAITLAFAFFDPNFFVAYLISIAIFGLFQAISMANSGGSWDNAKKYVEVDLREPSCTRPPSWATPWVIRSKTPLGALNPLSLDAVRAVGRRNRGQDEERAHANSTQDYTGLIGVAMLAGADLRLAFVLLDANSGRSGQQAGPPLIQQIGENFEKAGARECACYFFVGCEFGLRPVRKSALPCSRLWLIFELVIRRPARTEARFDARDAARPIALVCRPSRFALQHVSARVARSTTARHTGTHTNDGQNYHPTHKWVLFGHHFAAIREPAIDRPGARDPVRLFAGTGVDCRACNWPEPCKHAGAGCIGAREVARWRNGGRIGSLTWQRFTCDPLISTRPASAVVA